MSFEKRQSLILELGFREEALGLLRQYLDLLWASNEELNLISRQMTFDELLDNHLIDCLLPLKHFPKRVKVAADFGSGGGLPGVMYAIQFPNTKFQLFEKSPRKREFLNRCKTFAPNLEIHGEIPRSLGPVELVTARAFKPMDVILDMSRDYYGKGGRYFLLKGRLEKIGEETALARKKFRDLKFEIIPLKSPVMEVERHLVLVPASGN
jgi:16S rRNA (guanine527-N7)-methyltransferase